MQLDTEYPLTSFKNYIGTFTAPRSGVITCTSTTVDVMYPYRVEQENMFEDGNEYEVTLNSLYGSRSYDFTVEEGVTYIMYANFIMNNGTVFKITMADKVTFELTGTSPVEGGIYQVSNGGQIVLDFNKSITYTSAKLSVREHTQIIKGNLSTGSILFDAKNVVWDLLSTGKAFPGDTMTISLEGLALASDPSILYQGTGLLELHLVIGDMPIMLESTENTSGSFLSYYTTVNEQGIIKLHFSGKVSPDQLGAQLKFGAIDLDADGDYYVERLQPTLSEDGKTVIVNLQGKRRKAQDMVASGTNYGEVFLGITGVMDEKGNYAYASGSGSLGSYWYSFDFQEITAEVFCEFTPASGSKLTEKNQTIELWVTDEDKLSYDSACFIYIQDGEERTCVVKNENIQKEADPDDNTATILTIPVPAEVLTGNDVHLTLLNLQCADGSDYSGMLSARYATNDCTAMTHLSAERNNRNKAFNLRGQESLKGQKGISIQGGKKIVIRF